MKNMVVIAIICLWIVSYNFIMAGIVNSDVTLQKVFQSSSSSIKTAKFSPDGKYFLSGGDYTSSISIWNTKTFTLYREIDLYKYSSQFPTENKPRSFVGVDFTPDSKSVYIGLNNGMSAIILLDTLKFKVYEIKNSTFADGKNL